MFWGTLGGHMPLGWGWLPNLPCQVCSQTQGSAAQAGPRDRLMGNVLPAAWQPGSLVKGLFLQEPG